MTVFEFPVRRAAFGLLAAALFTGPDGVLAQDKPEDGGEAVAVVAVPTEVRAAASAPVFRSPDNALHAFLPLPEDMRVDGILDEEAWASARVFTGFVQETPVEGAPVEHDTEVRVIFGDGAIWVAARMWDSEPHRIVSRMDRRDD